MRKLTLLLLTALLPMLALAQRRPPPELEMVMVNVRVADVMDRAVTGLRQEDFEISEDKVRQKIEYFGIERVPVTLGIIFDVSKSMDPDFHPPEMPTIHDAARATADFLRAFSPNDQFFLMRFNDSIVLDVDFTNDIRPLQDTMLAYVAKGQTRLWQAVVDGIKKAKQGKNPRKAVVVVSDGDRDSTALSEKSLAQAMHETYVQVYFFNSYLLGHNQQDRNMNDAHKIAAALKNQYLLGYYSTNENPRNGKWHDIRVRVKSQPRLGPFTVTSRPGYFASN